MILLSTTVRKLHIHSTPRTNRRSSPSNSLQPTIGHIGHTHGHLFKRRFHVPYFPHKLGLINIVVNFDSQRNHINLVVFQAAVDTITLDHQCLRWVFTRKRQCRLTEEGDATTFSNEHAARRSGHLFKGHPILNHYLRDDVTKLTVTVEHNGLGAPLVSTVILLRLFFFQLFSSFSLFFFLLLLILLGSFLSGLFGSLLSGLLTKFLFRLLGGLLFCLLGGLLFRLLGSLLSGLFGSFLSGLLGSFLFCLFGALLFCLFGGFLFRLFGSLPFRLFGGLFFCLFGSLLFCLFGSLLCLLLGSLLPAH